MREAGDVCYADVFKDGTGVVEFQRSQDMRYAVKKLDDTKFRSHEVNHTNFFFTCGALTTHSSHTCPPTMACIIFFLNFS